MANEEHLKLVRSGVTAINGWAFANAKTSLDLTGANLSGAILRDAFLDRADLRHADLRHADLRESHLSDADLRGADLRDANLRGAGGYCIILRGADLRGANLSGMDLSGADVRGADLRGTDLSDSDIRDVDLSGAGMDGVRLTRARCGNTSFVRVSIGSAIGLETLNHSGPSIVDRSSLMMSKGVVPAPFLRGCGFADWEILAARLYSPELPREELDRLLYEASALRAGVSIQINALFISYSHADTTFVDALELKLNEKGIRFWRDTHDIKAGRVEKQLMRAIAMNPSFLLVLSKNSVNSDWVEWEAARARELEKELNRDVMCPVALDDAWKTCSWPGPLRRQIEDYHILDFARWQDADFLTRQFQKLIEGLRLFYGQAREDDGDRHALRSGELDHREAGDAHSLELSPREKLKHTNPGDAAYDADETG